MITFEYFNYGIWLEIEIPNDDHNREWVLGDPHTRNIRFS